MSAAMDYMQPNHTRIFMERAERLRKLRDDPRLLAAAKIHYKTHPWDFVADWGMTFDPRKLETGGLANLPFIPWPRQVEYMQWLYDRWQCGERGLVEKSRDCGVTWLSVGFAVALWCSHDGLAIGFGSRKEALVDKLGDPDSIFEKIRHFVQHLPPELLPQGFEYGEHASYMRLLSPETGASITGEAGDNIGRGGRKAFYFVDEAQPLSSAVLTPDGWSEMGSLCIGDLVLGRDGKPKRILGVNEAGVAPVWEVEFSDGTTARASENHLWSVRKVWGRREEIVLRTRELAESYCYQSPGGQKQFRYRLPTAQPAQFSASVALPIHPYVLGALLGDGCLCKTSVTLTSADPELAKRVEALLPDGYSAKQSGKPIDYYLVHESGRGTRRDQPLALRDSLELLGLRGCRSWEKRVPECYLTASVGDRLELLRGLMDTDGSASGGRATFHSASRDLADAAAFLARSLGGMATQSVKPDHRGHRDQHYVYIALPEGMSPFWLERKRQQIQPRKYEFAKAIVGVRRVGAEQVRCIQVEGEHYITDGFAVTHNCAFIERQQLVDAALSQATNCQIDISTFNGNGNLFFQKRERFHGTRRHFVFDWRDDPRKDEAWYQRQKDEQPPEIVAQEIDRDPNASNTDSFIPAKWVAACIDAHIKLGFEPGGIRTVGFDPADTGDAKAIVKRYGAVITDAIQKKDGDITDALPWAYLEADDFRADLFIYDGDGMGAPVIKVDMTRRSVGRWQMVEYRASGEVRDKDIPVVHGDTAGKTNGDSYFNFRAQSWTWVRERFRRTYEAIQRLEKGLPVNLDFDKAISISSQCQNLRELQGELSRPKRLYTDTGKIMVESKKKMKAREVESPNLADAVVIAFSESRMPDLNSAAFEPPPEPEDY